MMKLQFAACLLAIALIAVFAQAQDTLTILHVNDTHSHLLPYGPKDADGNGAWGGMARLATVVGMTRMSEPNTMLFHSGDLFTGDFMFQEYIGVAELEIMKALQYDALELGNHEFDLYPQTLEYVLNRAGFPAGPGTFPVLCANLDLSGDPVMANFVRPYTIKQVGNTKIGIFGLLTDFTNQNSNPAPITVLPPLNVASAWVDTLRNGHSCDIVILLSHMGIDMDQATAANIPGIDIIVGGHTHSQINTPIQIGNTLIVQAGEFARYLGKLKVVVSNGTILSWNYKLLSVDNSVPAEPNLAGMIGQLAAGIEMDPRFGPVYTQNIGIAKNDIEKPLHIGLCRDNGLGNLVADAMRAQTGTDIAFQPQGFNSQTIYAGPLKGNEIFQAVPYGFDQASGLGFKLATFQTTGAALMAGLEFSVYNMPYMEDFFLHGSNIAYVYNSSNAPGSRVDYTSITVNGQPVNPSATYTVTVPDGVVPFLNQIPGFTINNLNLTNQFVYNVVKGYVTGHSPISFYSEGRAIDLAPMAEPATGIDAIADVVALYKQSSAIRNICTANQLSRMLSAAKVQIERGHPYVALLDLWLFKAQVLIGSHFRTITPVAAQRLIYFSDKLCQSIRTGLPKEAIADNGNEEVLPDQMGLAQNYPNPFNPQTQISFALPIGSDVNLTVYDLLGRQVKVLVNGYCNAGTNNVIWDGLDKTGKDVASGVYFYRLQAGDFVQTKKMSLLR
jgi:5'-nucleotidase / UDP-sugar diphosphatase